MPLKRTVIQLTDPQLEWLDKKCKEGYTKAGLIRAFVQEKLDEDNKETWAQEVVGSPMAVAAGSQRGWRK